MRRRRSALRRRSPPSCGSRSAKVSRRKSPISLQKLLRRSRNRGSAEFQSIRTRKGRLLRPFLYDVRAVGGTEEMPSAELLIAFFMTTAVFAYIPGPAMLYAAGQSMARGRFAGLMATLGIHLGCYVHVFAAAGGLSV